jgi:hypothetical protein
MTKPRINHPFQVPDDFFTRMEADMEIKLDKITLQEKKKSVVLQIIKYAAIVFVAVFLGRISAHLYPGKSGSTGEPESLSVDLVLSQVSDEDVSEFIMDNITQEVLNQ